jgi:NTE family protein
MQTRLTNHRAWAALLTAALTAWLLAGCAAKPSTASADLHPRTLAEVQERTGPRAAHKGEQRPTVALALGGGGLRGFAHVGVLQALEEAGLRPDIVVGTSAGSVVGAAYASGMPVEAIREAALAIKVSSLLDFTWQSGGFIRGDKLAGWVGTLIGSNGNDKHVEDFPIRFAAVATDLQSAQPMLLTQGPAGRVIQASSAVPGVQVPVAYEAGHLIDGGVTSLVPVRFARAMGADLVIAVDIYCRSPRAPAVNVLGVLGQVMQTQSCLIAAPELAEADVVIAPAVAVPDMADRPSQEQAIQAGYQAARAALARYVGSAAAVRLALRPY